MQKPLFEIKDKNIIINFVPRDLKFSPPLIISILFLVAIIALPTISEKMHWQFLNWNADQSQVSSPANKNDEKISANADEILTKINPPDGVVIAAVYGDIGPKLLAAGAIDFEKMKSLYAQSGRPLTEEQIKILKEGSNEQIKITADNSYFLLNLLWALGLANKNSILEEGPMTQYGEGKVGNFASTGGWTLGTKPAMDIFSKYEIVKLNDAQQKIVEDFAFNSYRPCCSNPTGFPDCNHGMAALALAELMASQGATAEQIFDAFKYLNGFWFPQTYFDIAKYFEAKEGKVWKDVDSRTVAGKDYSTPQGWQKVKQWLKEQGLIEQAPSGGGSCGVQ